MMRRAWSIDRLGHDRYHARSARGVVEDALDQMGWRWSIALSRWVDMLITIEECRA
jgi:hypothetical protein